MPDQENPASPGTSDMPGFDFGDARFNLEDPDDREILRFILSQALYGEATGVYCGKSLYAARSLEAAHFYVRQARQELAHLKLFADILRELDLEPTDGHWALKLLSSHNNYYPLKVLMEHAIGEGMVLDVFKEVLLQTLPDDDPRIPSIKKKLRVICREEQEHVAWGEKETQLMLQQQPYLRPAFFGLVELQLAVMPALVSRFGRQFEHHPVLSQLPAFLDYVRDRVRAQGRRLGYVPERSPSQLERVASIGLGLALYARSQLSRSRSRLDKTYLSELGFRG
jgi:rubrerythrin